MNRTLSPAVCRTVPLAALAALLGISSQAAPIFNAPTVTPISGCSSNANATGAGGPTMQVQGGGFCPPAQAQFGGPSGTLLVYGPTGATISGTGSGTFDNNGFFPIGFTGTGGTGNAPMTATFQINGITVASGVSPGFYQVANLLAGQVLSTWQVTVSSPFGSIPVFGPGAPQTNGYNYCVWLGTNNICNPAASSSQTNPIFPSSPTPVVNPRNPSGPPSWIFRNVRSGGRFDPPFVNGFQYDGVGGTRFDSITLPTGFGSSFTVWTGSGFSTSLGTFAAGAAVDFVLGGVDAFQVRNIEPAVDAALANAFPLQIFFEGGGDGSFDQTPIENSAVPEPSTWLLMAVALPLALRRWRS